MYCKRPVVCRLFGVAEGMECPHDRQPARKLTRDETRELLAEYWNLPDFKVLGIPGWLNKESGQDVLQNVLDEIHHIVDAT